MGQAICDCKGGIKLNIPYKPTDQEMVCQRCRGYIDQNEAYIEHSENGVVVSVEHYRCADKQIEIPRNKYHAKVTEIDGIRFDSQAEARRYVALKSMERSGEIIGLKIHPRYILQSPFIRDGRREREITYEGDFSYVKDNRLVVEDVKGLKTDLYKVKRKMFMYRYPDIKFIEVNA